MGESSCLPRRGILISIDVQETSSSVFNVVNTNDSDNSPTPILQDVKTCLKYLKIICLIAIWCVCSVFLMINNEKIVKKHQMSLQKDITNSYIIHSKPIKQEELKVVLEGPFLPPYYKNLTDECVEVWVQLMVIKEKTLDANSIKDENIILIQNISDIWNVPLVPQHLRGVVPEVQNHFTFNLTSFLLDNTTLNVFRLQFKTNVDENLPILLDYNFQPINPVDGTTYGAVVLCGLYILIIFDIVHRTLAAMLASTVSVAILAVLNSRPTMSEILSWINAETLPFLFSMMTLVTVFSETGIFDLLAVWTYKFTKGQLWPLINTLSVIVIIMACFLDNVTTALLITPVCIKLCEVMVLNPVPILMITVIFANIGGALTPIGDPPNVIIASNVDVVNSGVNFGVFTLHMTIGSLLCIVVVYIQLRIVYRNTSCFEVAGNIQEQDLKREIDVWERTAASVSNYTKDEHAVKESLLKKSEKLQGRLKSHLSCSPNKEKSRNQLTEFLNSHPITNKYLLLKSGIILLLVIVVLFLHSIPQMSKLGIGWTALLGAILLLLLHDSEHFEGIFSRIEWSTLIFFAALFILMEALAKLGLIEYIGQHTHVLIASVDEKYRLTAAIVLILWVSAIASAFVDNLPLTTMMVKVATELSAKSHLPLQPLIWALSFGACLGGNGSLFGSSSNIICAGIAEQHGYKFSFLDFMRMGIPVTISSLLITTGYLIVSHVVFEWH